jgi:hypothetical protein
MYCRRSFLETFAFFIKTAGYAKIAEALEPFRFASTSTGTASQSADHEAAPSMFSF